MDKNKLLYYKGKMLKQRQELEQTLDYMREHDEADQSENSPTELSHYDNHPADLGSQLFQLELNNALRVHEEHLLKEIHDAIGRMEDGLYGKCAFCGNEISEERLDALPYARLCIDCEESKEIDPEFLRNERSNEERFIWDSPMGRKYLNKQEDDEYEGLDYLNDVMKYGSADTPQDMGGYHDYEEFYTNEIDRQGIVDDMDRVSNDEYKRQLPD